MMQALQSSASSLKQSDTDIQFLPVEFLLQEEITAITSMPQAIDPHNNQSNRCLAHCWLDDDQREQGQRCLVACWQSAHHDLSRASSHRAHACSHAVATHPSGVERLHRVGPSHPCHRC